MNEILSGKKELCLFLKICRTKLEEIIKTKKAPIFKKDGTYKAVKEDLLIWYREYLEK